MAFELFNVHNTLWYVKANKQKLYERFLWGGSVGLSRRWKQPAFASRGLQASAGVSRATAGASPERSTQL